MIIGNNSLKRVKMFGQSVWLDYIRRDLIAGGELQCLIEEDGVQGITSNPSIFEKAIMESHDYDEVIRNMTGEGKNARAIYEAISLRDVKDAADMFRPLYDGSEGLDGYVSLEVDPHLAHDAKATIEECRRIWAALNRPNVFIKVPATIEGLRAIRQLISEGINVNVTLLFGLHRYRSVAEAYITGIDERLTSGESVSRIASVASFFVSRIDAVVDPLLEKISAQGNKEAEMARSALGYVAIASANMAYQIHKEIFGGDRFKKTATQGARIQRLLWASTGTKNPAHSDVKYVEALIGPDTIDTLPRETLDAYRDHGDPRARLGQDIAQATGILGQLPALGIDIDSITQRLEDEGVQKFIESFVRLMSAITEKGRT